MSILEEWQVQFSDEKVLSYGNAAQLLLESIATKEFFSSISVELYRQFVETKTHEATKLLDIKENQRIVVDFLSFLQTLVANRDKMIGNNIITESEQEEQRRHILGLSGMPM